MLIGSEKPLWGEFNKLLYCIVLYGTITISLFLNVRAKRYICVDFAINVYVDI